MCITFRHLLRFCVVASFLLATAVIPEVQAARHHSSISVGMALQNHAYSYPYWGSFRPYANYGIHDYRYRSMGSWSHAWRYPYYSSNFGYAAYPWVRIPVGFVVSSLPRTYTSVVIEGTPYYVSDGVYFREVARGYMVVEEPELKPQPPRIYPPSDLVVEVSRTSMRSGPGEEYPVIGNAYSGQPLKIVEEASKWYYVQHPHGHFGWVLKRDTRPTETEPN